MLCLYFDRYVCIDQVSNVGKYNEPQQHKELFFPNPYKQGNFGGVAGRPDAWEVSAMGQSGGRKVFLWDKGLQECVFSGRGKRKAVLLLHLPYASLHGLVITSGSAPAVGKNTAAEEESLRTSGELEQGSFPAALSLWLIAAVRGNVRGIRWPDILTDLPNYRKPNSHFCTRSKVSVGLEKGVQSLILTCSRITAI